MKYRHLFGSLLFTIVVACHIPDLGKINLSACIDECNQNTTQDCENINANNACFDDVNNCFQQASDCSDKCKTCLQDQTCTSQSDCDNDCVHLAKSCTDLIQPCVQSQQKELEKSLTEQCIKPLLDCIDSCIADTELQLKK